MTALFLGSGLCLEAGAGTGETAASCLRLGDGLATTTLSVLWTGLLLTKIGPWAAAAFGLAIAGREGAARGDAARWLGLLAGLLAGLGAPPSPLPSKVRIHSGRSFLTFFRYSFTATS